MNVNEVKNKQCLVVGGHGFIGRHLVNELCSLGSKVTVLDYNSCTDSPHEGVDYIALDVTNKQSVSQLNSEKYSYVFNLSGNICHSTLKTGGRNMIDTHYAGLVNLIEFIDRSELKCFVQIGSSDEYGNQASPQVETMREAPISCYSAAKVSASHLIQMLAKYETFPGTVLRFFLVYGPGQNIQRFIPQVIHGCLQGKKFPVSAGEQLRDFCYIDDVVEAIIMAATNTEARGEIFNIASGKPASIATMIKKIQGIIGSGDPIFGEIPYRQGENMSLYADISKAKDILGWSPKVSLDAGLAATIEYYKSKRKLFEECV